MCAVWPTLQDITIPPAVAGADILDPIDSVNLHTTPDE